MHVVWAADDKKSLKLKLKSRIEKIKLFPSDSWENIFLKISYRQDNSSPEDLLQELWRQNLFIKI